MRGSLLAVALIVGIAAAPLSTQGATGASAARRSLKRLRVIGWLEGASFLVLLGIAMPLKYLAGMPEMVRFVGWTHGLLFILFTAAVAHTSLTLQWPFTRIAAAWVAGLMPFGTFVLDSRLRKDLETAEYRDVASAIK